MQMAFCVSYEGFINKQIINNNVDELRENGTRDDEMKIKAEMMFQGTF